MNKQAMEAEGTNRERERMEELRERQLHAGWMKPCRVIFNTDRAKVDITVFDMAGAERIIDFALSAVDLG